MAIKPSQRQKKSELNKRRLLESALDLFREYGYNNVTIDDIVKNVNMSKGSFYNLFKSKEDLIAYRANVLGNKVLESYEQLTNEDEYKSKNSVEKLRELILLAVTTSTLNRNEEFLRLTFSNSLKNIPLADNRYYELHQIDNFLIDTIREGQDNGDLRSDIEPEEILRAIHIFNRSLLIEWCYNEGDYEIREKDMMEIEIFCRGISNC